MKLINEEHHVSGSFYFVNNGLDSFLKLAAILCAGNHQSKVERNDSFFAEKLRGLFVGDSLGKTFDNRRFSYACFADEDRIVLCSSAEYLNEALYFDFSADDGVKLAFSGKDSQVSAETVESRRAAFLLWLRSGPSSYSRDGMPFSTPAPSRFKTS